MNRSIMITMALALSTTPLCAQDIPLSKILVESEGWREAAKDWTGVVFLRGTPDQNVTIFQGRLRKGKQVIGRINADGQVKQLPVNEAEDYSDSRMVHVPAGHYIFSFDGQANTVNLVSKVSSAANWFKVPAKSPSCMTMWPDGGHLVIGEFDGAYLWAFRIEKDGSLGPGDRYYSLRTKPNEKMHVAAMTMDAGYLLYACTPIGIQVFDPTGRLSGVIAAPSKETMTAITIGGAKADELYVAAGDRIYARKIQGKASYTLKKAK